MNVSAFLSHLHGLGIRLRLVSDELKISAPDGVLTEELRAEIARQESDLVSLLREMMSGLGKKSPGIQPLPRGAGAELPLSFGQERFWFLSQLEGDSGSGVYSLPFAVRMRGALDVAAFEWSLGEIVRRHEALRTVFGTGEHGPVQVVEPAGAFELPVVDLAEHEDPYAQALRLAGQEALRPFDLARGPLYRFTLLRLAPDDHVVLLTLLHVVADGLSMGVLQGELTELYQARTEGRPPRLPALKVQYADFAAWQRKRYAQQSAGLLGYWRQQLDGLATLNLPTDRPRPARQTFRGRKLRARIPAELAEALNALGRKNGWTLFMMLLGAYQTLLARYTGQEDIVVGTPSANRVQPELEPLIGLFMNTLVLRADLSGEPSFRELMTRVREVALGAFEQQDMPFEQLVLELKPARDLSRNPLFQVLFNVLHAPANPTFAGVELEPIAAEAVTSMFDLSVAIGAAADGDGLSCIIEYNVDLFDAATIEQMETHFAHLLQAIARDPDQRIGDLPMLSEAEQDDLLVARNRTAAEYPRDRCFWELFAERAAAQPTAPAASFGGETLSYAELDARSDRLARHLRTLGAGPEVLVGLCVGRSLDLLVALLAIQKSGAAYVPLDPTYPSDRIEFILEDADAKLLVTTTHLQADLPAKVPPLVLLDADAATIAAQDSGDLERLGDARSLAYVIFTSGSTGKPKGVQIEHQALANFLATMAVRPGFTAEDVLVAVTTISFDIAGLELYLPLLQGGHVVIASDREAADGQALGALLATHGATVMQATPATWRLLVEADWENRKVTALCGGEALPRELAEQILPRCAALWNMYGPTETTIWSLVEKVSSGTGAVPIGGAIANTEIYLLDRHQQPVPIGVPGQLYLGGEGLARGYWNRPELTAEKFIEHPFSFEDDARLYDTGDLARYRRDGTLEFLGRVDHQVKIRGYRIELGEIEHVLTQHDAVAACAVMPQQRGGSDQLVAHIVLEAGAASVTPSELRETLRAVLPDYMVPPAYVVHEALPLTPNGKVDRKALQRSDAPRLGGGAKRLPPRTAMEKEVAAVWRDLLDVDAIGRHDNFFELGGHSLLIMPLRQKLKERTGRELSVAEVFQHPTVAALAEHLGGDADAVPVFAAVEARLRKQRTALTRQASGAIAVVGMAGRFPGAQNLDQFWANLAGGVESVRWFDDNELRTAGVDESLLGNPDYVKARGVLDDIESFDAGFFGVPAREAEVMDPQQRLFLESAYTALENAGYDPLHCPGAVGVWAGSAPNSYYHSNLIHSRAFRESADSFQLAISAYGGGFLATRVSYKLNLRGPSVEVQTACSTSLVAVVQACQSLLAYQCDMALAGGVALVVPHHLGYLYQEGLIFSPDGHCRPFDSKAQGTLGGEGVGVVALKRLEDALADGDPIRAVIRGGAANNDGSNKVGFTAPSVEGQSEVIAMALGQAGIDPATIGYVEAHGTGTPLGDPIEIGALTRAYRAHTDRKGFCAIGSVKSNFGHADAAAGVAGLIKTVLALEHRTVPQSLHFDVGNPEIDFASSPFRVAAETAAWPTGDDDTPRRAGVSSFGFGGTNAHVVLEEAPVPAVSPLPSCPAQLLTVSAKTEMALATACADLAAHLEARSDEARSDQALCDVAWTTQQSRGGLPHRRAVVCRDAAEAVAALTGAAPERTARGELQDEALPVAFLFPGQGAQHVGMGRELYDTVPVFAQHLDECCRLLEPYVDLDLRTVLYPPAGEEEAATATLTQTRITQPAVFAVEYALARTWMAWGVQPTVVVGHSIGEFVAACLAGVFSLADAARLVASRGAMMQALPAGDMLSVGLSEADVTARIAGSQALSLAAVNGPSACVVSGPADAVATLRAMLEADDQPCRLLHTSHAFHSSMMDGIVEPFVRQVEEAIAAGPRLAGLRCISTVTGTELDGDTWCDAEYWGRNLRQAVRFADAAATLLGSEDSLALLEVGPGNTLSTLTRQQGTAAAGCTIATSMRHAAAGDVSDVETLVGALGRLWVAGVAPDWAAVHEGLPRQRVELPAYPFERQRYWIEPGTPAAAPAGAPAAAPAADRAGVGAGVAAPLARSADVAEWFTVPSWERLPVGEAVELPEGPWLVFEQDSASAGALSAELARAGRRVATVSPGDAFRDLGDRQYVLRPTVREDYDALLAALSEAKCRPTRVVHVWSVIAAAPDAAPIGSGAGDALERAQDLGVHSLICLAQALGEYGDDPVAIDVVTNGLFDVVGGEVIHPERATLLGPCRVIPQEYPHMQCRVIDERPDITRFSWSGLFEEWNTSAPATSLVTARRGLHRWAQVLRPQRLDEAQTLRRLREGGTYLITGGLGGIGLVLAEHLFVRARARLVLIGRSGLPPRDAQDKWLAEHDASDETARRIRRVRALEEQGAEVLVERADVTDLGQMRGVVERAAARFGPIRGVVHAAGVVERCLVEEATPAAIGKILDPKVRGTLVLAEALRGQKEPLDFTLLCSSVSTQLGGLGLAAYAGANAFLDALVFSADLGRELKPVAVNWDTWGEVGVAAGPDVAAGDLQDAIPSAGGVEAFDRILWRWPPLRQVAVCPLDLAARMAGATAAGSPAAAGPLDEAAPGSEQLERHARPALATEFSAPETELECELAEVVQELLGLEAVGVHDNLFELGFDSLLAHRMIGRLKERFQTRFTLRTVLESPTVGKLAKYVRAAQWAASSQLTD